MEKRLILAIILSFFILYGWAILQPKKDMNISQHIDNVIVKSQDVPVPASSKLEASPKHILKEEINSIETPELKVYFSNNGGVLSRAYLKKYGVELPVTNILNLSGYGDKKFDLLNLKDNEIVYFYEDENYKIIKNFRFNDQSYGINSEISIQGKSRMSSMDNIYLTFFDLNLSNLTKNNDQRNDMLREYSVSFQDKIFRKYQANHFNEDDNKLLDGDMNWVGFRDRYYATIIKPLNKFNEIKIEFINKEKLSIIAKNKNTIDSIIYKNLIYIGPQESDILKKYDLGLENIVNYNIGGFFDIFAFGLGDISAKFLLSILKFLHKIIPIWGLCIIILASMICLGTYPMTIKNMISMKKMQKLQPELNKIREKNKNNPQKMQQETMELYKKYNVNPFGGCLVMFLQMPIFYGIIQLLWRYVGLKEEKFLWIKDLSEPDRLFILPFSLPVLGNEINVLPLIVFVLVILQQFYANKNSMVTDQNMIMQQKMMQYMLPVMIILFFYHFSSAVGIYFTIFYAMQTFIQWELSRVKIS